MRKYNTQITYNNILNVALGIAFVGTVLLASCL